jgi:AcrR family transcriptional regulator
MPSVTDGQAEPEPAELAQPGGPAEPGATAGPAEPGSPASPASAGGAGGAAGLPGRRGQAARNDAMILAAAREVFLADPKAPMAAVAEHAGVGMSAVYRRYASKEDLLRRLCQDGLQVFIAEAMAVAAEPDAARALSRFLERVVAADVHSLTVHLAGTFTPTPQLGADAVQASGLVTDLVDRAHASGQLRPDVGPGDIQLVLEGCAAVRVPDPARTTELRLRYLALLLDGLFPARAAGAPGEAPGAARTAGPGREPLPFPAPQPGELNWRWAQ